MPRVSVRTLALFLPLVTLAACAAPRDGSVMTGSGTAPTPATAQVGEVKTVAGFQVIGEGTRCAFANDVRDWRVVDRDHIILDTYKKSYLLRVSGLCNAKPDEQLTIGIGSSAGSVCPSDPLIVAGQRCSIREMWELPKTKAAGGRGSAG